MSNMLFLILLVFNFLIAPSLLEKLYDEKYRPQLHYSPPKGWMNDPNGLVYHDGLFHLFCQHNPKDIIFGPIHWGHAVSSDLVHWRTLPIAIYPEGRNSIFSGSTIVDYNNITGLQMNKTGRTLIAVFTAHDVATNEQRQWIAYSNDEPLYEHFKFYSNNPIIANPDPIRQADFRDPAVLSYKDKFVILLAALNRTIIYNSPDLLTWSLVSEFGEFDGSHKGVWECPSLFPINVTMNGEQIEKTILIISVGPNMQYFIGSFDGKVFTNENPKETELWLDAGPDSYAGITYNLLPDGRCIFISWMNQWEYAQSMNFSIWNGQMGIARELKLIQTPDNQIRLTSLPVREIETLRTKHVRKENIPISEDFTLDIDSSFESKEEHLLDIQMIFELTKLKTNDTLEIEFSGSTRKLSIHFAGGEFSLDRTNAGRKDFSPNYGLIWKAPRLINTTEMELRIIIDRSSIELYADGGLTVMTALYFSDEALTSKMEVSHGPYMNEPMVDLKKLDIFKLKSIWF